jgi:hypothetical protein
MPPTLFLIFNHRFTAAQEAAARDSLGVSRIALPPPDLQKLWSQVPPDIPALAAYLQPLQLWLAAQARPGDFVLIQGDFGATYLLVRAAFALGLIPVYATTRRQVAEDHLPDGTVKMTRYFQHQIFRRYSE